MSDDPFARTHGALTAAPLECGSGIASPEIAQPSERGRDAPPRLRRQRAESANSPSCAARIVRVGRVGDRARPVRGAADCAQETTIVTYRGKRIATARGAPARAALWRQIHRSRSTGAGRIDGASRRNLGALSQIDSCGADAEAVLRAGAASCSWRAAPSRRARRSRSTTARSTSSFTSSRSAAAARPARRKIVGWQSASDTHHAISRHRDGSLPAIRAATSTTELC